VFTRLFSATFAIAALALPVAAQDAETVLKARKSHMTLNSFYIAPLGAMAQGDIDYDADAAARAAANLAAVAGTDQDRLWMEGSGQPEMPDSRALAAIWENPEDFATKIDNLATATAALADVAGDGLDALRGGIGPVGNACGACHEDYREER